MDSIIAIAAAILYAIATATIVPGLSQQTHIKAKTVFVSAALAIIFGKANAVHGNSLSGGATHPTRFICMLHPMVHPNLAQASPGLEVHARSGPNASHRALALRDARDA